MQGPRGHDPGQPWKPALTCRRNHPPACACTRTTIRPGMPRSILPLLCCNQAPARSLRVMKARWSEELCAFGGEWLPMTHHTINPLRIFQNARRLARLIADERIDIVHAQSAAGAWSAHSAIDRMPVFLVTSFPDRVPARSWAGDWLRRSLARGDRVIAPSSYVSRAMIERYKLPAERITVIPRAIDTTAFDPGCCQRGSHQFAAPRLGRIAGHACRSGAGSPRSVERATRHGRRRASSGHRQRRQYCIRVCRRRSKRTALCACAAPPDTHARHRHTLPVHRPMSGYARCLCRRRRRGSPRRRAAFVGPCRCRGAGEWPACGDDNSRGASRIRARPATHAR